MQSSVNVILIDPQGTEHRLEVPIGQSIMESAVVTGVPGVSADCGGAPQCATCSVFVPEEWLETTGEADDLELGVLEFNGKLDSKLRLSCQLIARPEWEGLTLLIPERQY